MSVYTTVSAEDLDAWLARYTVGALVELKPIASGIENTNYFVTTAKGRYVLTLYERLPAEDLPFYLNLMAHLARSGCEVPAPEPDRTGALFSIMNGKPAGLVARVEGAPVERPDAEPLPRGGRGARAHAPSPRRPTARGSRTGAGRRGGGRRPAPCARSSRPRRTTLLQRELAFLQGFAKLKLPKAAIHADLFCDNVLFADDAVAGIIDFGFAATDFLAYDVAIAVNDWCDDGSGGLDADRAQAFLSGYHAVRPLTDEERTHWPDLLRAAALRFWLSRLYDLYLPRPGELTHAHDPSRFERILATARAGRARRCPRSSVARPRATHSFPRGPLEHSRPGDGRRLHPPSGRARRGLAAHVVGHVPRRLAAVAGADLAVLPRDHPDHARAERRARGARPGGGDGAEARLRRGHARGRVVAGARAGAAPARPVPRLSLPTCARCSLCGAALYAGVLGRDAGRLGAERRHARAAAGGPAAAARGAAARFPPAARPAGRRPRGASRDARAVVRARAGGLPGRAGDHRARREPARGAGELAADPRLRAGRCSSSG